METIVLSISGYVKYNNVKNLLETEVRKLELELSASQSRARELEAVKERFSARVVRLEERVRAGLAFCKDHKVSCKAVHSYFFGGEFRCDCGLDDTRYAALAEQGGNHD